MPKKSAPPAPYPAGFRRRMVELVRSGRTPTSLAKDFPPSAQTIANWVKQADLDEGKRTDGLTTEERAELARLRREVKVLQEPSAPTRSTPRIPAGAAPPRATSSVRTSPT